MDFERLERAWRSNANSPSEAASIYLVEETMDTLKKRRQSFKGFTVWIGVVTTLWMLKIGYDVIFNPFPFDINREWSALILLTFPWVALFVIRARHRRHLEAHPDPYASMPATLRALIDENAAAQWRTRFSALLNVAAIAVLALALYQLREVGKMTAQNVLQGSILFGAIFAGIWAYYAVNYFRTLKPEGERLKRLLADYEEGAAA